MRCVVAVIVCCMAHSVSGLHPQAEAPILDPYATARFAATQRSRDAPEAEVVDAILSEAHVEAEEGAEAAKQVEKKSEEVAKDIESSEGPPKKSEVEKAESEVEAIVAEVQEESAEAKEQVAKSTDDDTAKKVLEIEAKELAKEGEKTASVGIHNVKTKLCRTLKLTSLNRSTMKNKTKAN